MTVRRIISYLWLPPIFENYCTQSFNLPTEGFSPFSKGREGEDGCRCLQIFGFSYLFKIFQFWVTSWLVRIFKFDWKIFWWKKFVLMKSYFQSFFHKITVRRDEYENQIFVELTLYSKQLNRNGDPVIMDGQQLFFFLYSTFIRLCKVNTAQQTLFCFISWKRKERWCIFSAI